MRARHGIFLLAIVAALAGILVGCDLLGFVSPSARVSEFESALNSATRAAAYQNFHPDKTSDYSALKDPVPTLDPIFPRLGTGDAAYSLTVTDDASPSSGVFVTVTGGPAGFGAPKYLKLVMETVGTGDNRIVSLEMSTTKGSFPGPAQIK